MVPHASVAPPGELAEAQQAESPWLADQVMVMPSPGLKLEEIASRYGVGVLRPVGTSGRGALSVPVGLSHEEFELLLLEDGAVSEASPMGRTAGAATTSAISNSEVRSRQWHLDAIRTPSTTPAMAEWIVAVLDTGVAYRNATVGGRSYSRAQSLKYTPVVAPKDFVDNDRLPLDEHQHGTHIATTLLGYGHARGVAPGATLMPVRVLDAYNRGTELDLVEGIHWAVENGAHVINLSLSFELGYVPSLALREALNLADQAGAIVVAAAGNHGVDDAITWPAASPQVIAVGAHSPRYSLLETPTPYSNRSAAVDIVAPGGDFALDVNRDGYMDGILSDTIALRDPSRVGYWFYAGTSQSAAIVSGAVVCLLDAGVQPSQIRAALQAGVPFTFSPTYLSGMGAGRLDLTGALESIAAPEVLDPPQFQASVLPYLALSADGTQVQPRFRVHVVDEAGNAPPFSFSVYATTWTQDQPASASCALFGGDTCTIYGDWTSLSEAGAPAAWMVQVDNVGSEWTNVASSPVGMMYLSDGLEVVLEGLQSEPGLADRILAVHWEQAADPDLGSLAESYAVPNWGSGLSSSPIGVLFRPSVLGGASTATVDVNLDGTGLSSSPIGFVRFTTIDFNGTGLSSSPIGSLGISLIAFNGTGLSSSPIGFRALSLTQGSSLVDLGLGLNGSSYVTGQEASMSALAADSTTGQLLLDGGWLTADGYDGPTALVATQSAPTGISAMGTDSTGAGASEEAIKDSEASGGEP